MKSFLPLEETAAAVAAGGGDVEQPACWKQAEHAEDVDDGGDEGPVKRTGVPEEA